MEQLKTQTPNPKTEAALVLAFLALAVTGFLWAAIFTGRCFSPSDLLYAYSPWSTVQPAGWTQASVSNPTELDIPLIIEPWLEYGAKRLHAGELPLWNPDNMLGAPFIGNDQSGVSIRSTGSTSSSQPPICSWCSPGYASSSPAWAHTCWPARWQASALLPP